LKLIVLAYEFALAVRTMMTSLSRHPLRGVALCLQIQAAHVGFPTLNDMTSRNAGAALQKNFNNGESRYVGKKLGDRRKRASAAVFALCPPGQSGRL